MQRSQILKFVNSSEIQKYKYIENETSFFLKKKKSLHDTLRAAVRQKIIF